MKRTKETLVPDWAHKHRDVLVMIGLAFLCLTVYGRCVTFTHTLYDDPNIIFENPQVMAGLTWDSIRWAFMNPNFGLYMPLPTLTFMLDRTLFGDWDGGYHGMTLLWHLACVLTFYWVMRRLTGAFYAVLAAAALVAVHPVQAMTVNWISARNEIMPAFFMLLSVDMYRRYCGHPQEKKPGQAYLSRYWAGSASVVLMFLGIMSKQGIVLLPVVLLLLDYWPLRRIELSFRAPLKTATRMLVLTLEKLPWFALSGLAVALAIYGKRDFGAFQGETLLSPLDNIGFALTAYARYLFHLVYPERYIMAYSASGWEPAGWMIAGAALLLAGITALAFSQLWKRPWFIVLWGWFVLFLLPVSGLVRYASESIALRYLYAPGMGLYLLAGFGFYELARRLGNRDESGEPPLTLERRGTIVFWVVLIGATALSGLLAYRQSGFWRTAETLAQRALVVTGGANAMAHNHLGVLRSRAGLQAQAHAHLQRAMEVEPDRLLWKINYAMTLNQRRRYEETLALIGPELEERPENVTLLNLYGGALTGLNRFQEAVPYFERVLTVEPRYVPSLYNLGLCMQHLNRLDEARRYYEQALALQPNHQRARAALEELTKSP